MKKLLFFSIFRNAYFLKKSIIKGLQLVMLTLQNNWNDLFLNKPCLMFSWHAATNGWFATVTNKVMWFYLIKYFNAFDTFM